MGLLIVESEVKWIEVIIEDVVVKGVMLYVGGKVIGMLFFVIVLLGVKFGMCVFDEEIFGFVVVIVEYFIDVEVVELVNVLEFGLVGLVIGVDVDCVKVIVM